MSKVRKVYVDGKIMTKEEMNHELCTYIPDIIWDMDLTAIDRDLFSQMCRHCQTDGRSLTIQEIYLDKYSEVSESGQDAP